MQLVEQHVMKQTDSRYQVIDEAAFASKNLYNAANYVIRQTFIHEGVYLCYEEMHARMKSHETYKALPRKVSQQVLRLLHKNWVSFFKAIEAWKKDPSQFLGRPCLPKYKEKQHGRNILIYKSMLKDTRFTARMERITTKRTRRIDHYLHTASRRVIDLLVSEGIGTLVIGKNPNWKQEVEMGRRNNQRFVCIPHARFIDMLTYKAQLVGIRVMVTEESYTSKCSFLDNESIGKHEHYLGKRVKRGLFRAATGEHINADVNGSYNIVRKVVPDAFGQGDRGCVVHPTRLAV